MKKLISVLAIMLPVPVCASAVDGYVYPPRARVIIDNDFAGDPDGIVALTHHLMSPSVEVVGVVGSYFPANGMPGLEMDCGASEGVRKVLELYEVMDLENPPIVYKGGERQMQDPSTPVISPGAELIVREAMREDANGPLYVACGGSLNTIASALLLNPEIADRLTLVWIGGPETLETQIVPPGAWAGEYNLNLDIAAAMRVFNESGVAIWMVPRAAYRQCNYSHAELAARVRPAGALGAYIYDAVMSWFDLANENGWGVGETYVLGDSPLVLLTALQSFFEADPSSSDYVITPSPEVLADGTMQANPGGRPIRVYTYLDTRLMFADMEAKLQLVSK